MQLKCKPTPELQDTFRKAQELSKVTTDPVSNPFKSKYEARELLINIKNKLHDEETFDHQSLKYRYVMLCSAGIWALKLKFLKP